MYEQVSHSLLNRVLEELPTEIREHDLQYFHTRMGANFYAIYSLFSMLYGKRDDFEDQLSHLIKILAQNYVQRDQELKELDQERERDHNWFLDQQWVGMALYANAYADDLSGLGQHLGYLQELGVNLVHVMPVLKCPPGASDGGYAVSDFRSVDERVGNLADIRALSDKMRLRDMLLTLDVVMNHTSDQHEWVEKARSGEQDYQDYYYVFDDREVPDMYEESMPEVFPETAPGNFTWDEAMGKWVMTVFNTYQWDLNYRNPAVFIEMIDVLLFWANQGADILRLDAVAFLWKKIGTTCQNEQEAHLILQLMKDCCQVVSPGVLFIAEAIVAPVEITKYFGEDAVIAKECEIAYNATFMSLLWDAVATKNAKLLNQGIQHLPDKLDRATWLNYIRCHDDIGLGFDNADVVRTGYEPRAHRKFLIDYYTGEYEDSPARGKPFGQNEKIGDARIAGSLASLAGLETSIESKDENAINLSIDLILLLHGLIMSFGGIPLLYSGDELGMINDYDFMNDESKAGDSRWIHRPQMDWEKAEKRRVPGTPEEQIFMGLQHMIALRKCIPAFADFNNRELIETSNEHLFVFMRNNPFKLDDRVLVVGNFDHEEQSLTLSDLGNRGQFKYSQVRDLLSGELLQLDNDQLTIPPCSIYWLTDH